MKKSLITLAVLGAAAGSANAQSGVTLYGVIDGSIEYLTSSRSSAFGCRLTAERTRIPTALRDALRSHFGGFLLRRAA
ncbi:porin [Cupriavidus sp. KK10]|jgi:predicted porin|uniref:porin n=1 Tax=Cupriavidus sp. KK10 TaxID=1478019 RepID=UPI0035303BBC